MTHERNIKDNDISFYINPSDRGIYNKSPGGIVLIQGDHNSVCPIFGIPRFIDGHDITLCDKLYIHYSNKIARNEGDYLVTDMTISPSDENFVLFSWLISENITMHPGILTFTVNFLCNDAGGNVIYSWGTRSCGTIIRKRINNGESISGVNE